MPKTVQEADLYFAEGTSDKEYHIQIVEEEGGVVVNFQYGRRGGNLQSGTKTPAPVSIDKALEIYQKVLDEKLNKGYHY